MKLFILGLCFLLGCFQESQALRCMQGTELVDANDSKQKEKMPEYTECGFTSAVESAAKLALLKPNTIALPTSDYKCFHLRFEESKTNAASILKGCIYKNQDVCDGKFKADTLREVFCSQCDQDECNSAIRFASKWKVLSLTIFAILCYFMN